MLPKTVEKRSVQRDRRRFPVKFEAQGVDGTGFTANVSATGMQIHSNLALAPGSVIRGRMVLPGGIEMDFEAEVRWVYKVTGPLAQLVQTSIGLKFVVPPSEVYFRLLAKALHLK
jgi:hypothetical protein